MYWVYVLGLAVCGYLLGNLNGAIIISRLLMKEDVRTHGSGNAGLTNFFRSYGGASTLLVLVIDLAKAVAAALVGGWLLGRFGQAEFGKMLGGVFTVVGHMFPVFFGFRGGKGILCCAGIAAVMDGWLLLVILLVFILVLALSRYVSLASCIAAVVFPFAFMYRFWGNLPVILLAFTLAVGVIFMHRENIKRLMKGTENKFSFHRKK